jgi:ADP-ribose pyrophosphatase YjhB (NUDIX family)
MDNANDFTAQEELDFIRLLKKIQGNGYWVPTLTAWREVQRTFSRWALELVITDTDDSGMPKIFLSRYDGEGIVEHAGLFHIPGGFERLPESIQETCSRIAKTELGVDVRYEKVLNIHKWTAEEHPWGSHFLSVYVKCTLQQNIECDESHRFFSRAEILTLSSDDMVSNHPHRAFADEYLKEMGAI